MNILLICPIQDGTIETVESVLDHARRLIVAREEPTDLVVLPEGYLSIPPEQEREGAYLIMREYSLTLNCPLLMGMSTIDGPEKAYYINPFAEEGETHYHTIVKHSSANQILFNYEQQSYKTFDAPSTTMYEPIRLNGRDIQPIICHDMFFPLITSRLYAEGMDVMINLTGGGVVRSKWHQMLSGLSEAYHAPVLCTMNRYESSKTSETIAYDRLDRIVPSEEQIIDGHQFSWIAPEHYTQYDIEPPARWSDKRYDALTVGQDGDVSLGERAGTLSTTLPIVSQKKQRKATTSGSLKKKALGFTYLSIRMNRCTTRCSLGPQQGSETSKRTTISSSCSTSASPMKIFSRPMMKHGHSFAYERLKTASLSSHSMKVARLVPKRIGTKTFNCSKEKRSASICNICTDRSLRSNKILNRKWE